jgi:hypothetical protein
MDDTPQHIKDLQLKLWLSKTPGERLRQFVIDNENLFRFWKAAKEQLAIKDYPKGQDQST